MAFRVFISLLLWCVGGIALADQPNIVFVLADDLGIGDVKCFGGEQCRIDTPNIDALAKNGLKFTDAHVNASVCEPTRVAIMTGRYPWRFGRREPGGPWGFVGPRFDANTFTLGRMFGDAGYTTGYVGKWHLGTRMQTKDGGVQGKNNVDYTKPLTYGPVQLGFDESFILPGSLDMFPYAFARNGHWQGNVAAKKGWSAFNRVGDAEVDFEDHEVLETFYREAEDFIASQGEAPFFLFLALTAPHTPTSPGVAFQGKSDLGVYGDFVMEVDHGVERVVAALRNRGLLENTLILFSSDHGPAPYAGNILKATPGQIHMLEAAGHHPNGRYRGYKFSLYEGGLRVPLIAHWPARIKSGGTCDQLVGMCDLMSTFAEIIGENLSPEHGSDSISFAPLLADPKRDGQRKDLIMQSTGPFAVRDGDWKLCLCPGSGSYLEYGNSPNEPEAWRKVWGQLAGEPSWEDLEKVPFVQLYNLANDPGEDHNLASENPQRVAAMVNLLRRQIENGRSTPGRKLRNDRENIKVIQRLPDFVREQLNGG